MVIPEWLLAANDLDPGNCYKITWIVPCLSGRTYVKIVDGVLNQ